MGDTASVAERAQGAEASVPVRLAAVFLPAPLPRDGRVAFWDPDGGPLPAEDTELTVVRRHGVGVRRRTAPAVSLPVGEALPLLVRARRDPAAHPATACWGAAALHALRLTARGRLLPGLTATGHDAWRAGPWTRTTSRTSGPSPRPCRTRAMRSRCPDRARCGCPSRKH